MTRWRRLVRDYERRIDVSKAMIFVAMGAMSMQGIDSDLKAEEAVFLFEGVIVFKWSAEGEIFLWFIDFNAGNLSPRLNIPEFVRE